MKRAIVYYSLTGNTKEAAESIAEKLQADIIRIDTVKPMPDGRNKQIMYGGMLATFGIKPAITGVPDNLAEYDELIIGTPVWAGKMAPTVLTFLTKSKVCDKVTGAILLSGSGNAEKCAAALQKMLPGLTHVVSLADHYNEISAGNAEKLGAFVKEYE